jgi:hypothetical protein
LGRKEKEDTIFSNNIIYDGLQDKFFYNEFIQLFVETGIFGFLLLVPNVIINLVRGIVAKDFIHISFAVLMISLFLTESFLSRQRGIVFFTIMFCLFNTRTSKAIKLN